MPRSKSSRQWLKNFHDDPFVHQARAEGYRGRAIYKLKAIQDKYQIIQSHHAVLDLGAAPGSWCQWLENIVTRGRLVGCDLLPIKPLERTRFVQGDFTETSVQEILLDQGKYDCIVCDMAPNSTGHAQVDQWQASALCEHVFAFCEHGLKANGSLVIKLFQGADFENNRHWLKEQFKQVACFKPPASRPKSKELYAIAQGYNT